MLLSYTSRGSDKLGLLTNRPFASNASLVSHQSASLQKSIFFLPRCGWGACAIIERSSAWPKVHIELEVSSSRCRTAWTTMAAYAGTRGLPFAVRPITYGIFVNPVACIGSSRKFSKTAIQEKHRVVNHPVFTEEELQRRKLWENTGSLMSGPSAQVNCGSHYITPSPFLFIRLEPLSALSCGYGGQPYTFAFISIFGKISMKLLQC